MNNSNAFRGILIVVMMIMSSIGYSQKTNIYAHSEVDFKTALELFQKEKYSAAQEHFNKIVASKATISELTRIDAEYYSALCAIELFNKDGEYYLKQFINNHPESPKVKTACFHLGRYNFRKNKYKDALEWFEKVDIYELTEGELSEYYFKRGYSYFNEGNFEKASKDFYELKDIENKYKSPAKYYFAHIAYQNKNYETSLVNFQQLQKDETFGAVVPYYIVQLYHLQKKYDSVISYAPKILDTINSKRKPQMARIVGEAYYHTAKFDKAIPYFLKYEEANTPLSREDNYQIAFSYYQTKNYEKALLYFNKAADDQDDSLAQNITYHLADCYLKSGEKINALQAFKKASKMSFDPAIKEDALYNYAKLTYETSYNPYSNAIKGMKAYIKKYPNSQKADEIYGYLVNAFITIKNYAGAMEAIDSIKTLTPDLKITYQKAACYAGIEYFNNSEYKEAIQAFDKSLKYSFDKSIKAQSIYWKGELYYRLKEYEKAIATYKEYMDEPGAVGKKEREHANYNIGYVYYEQGDYTSSNLWFRKFVGFNQIADELKVNDAYNRIGDGYFMQADYSNAAEYYGKSYKMKKVDADYALYQKALVEGLQKKHEVKITDLKTFLKEYPASSYGQKAKYELAQTYLTNNQNDEALREFLKLLEEYPNGVYVNGCLSKIGLIYRNQQQDDKALEYFDRLIKRDRKSAEANEAVAIVKSIYENKGDIDGVQAYLKTIGESIPEAKLDSILFEAGKKNYMSLDCEKALADMNKYIQRFPEGIFIVQAYYYKARCEYSSNKMDDALTSYQYICSKNKNAYTEEALYRTATILYLKEDYNNAAEYFEKLKAMAGDDKNKEYAVISLMRCYRQLKDNAKTLAYAKSVLDLPHTNNELIYEAHFNIAHGYYAIDSMDDALAEFRAVSHLTNNDFGAEAAYYVALIEHNKGEYKAAEKTIFTLINGEANSPFWITNSLLLLADNYVALKDNFQAKSILNSIITDSDIPEMIKRAQEKLDKIKADEEAAKNVKTETAPIQLMFDSDDNVEQKKLFNEEPVQVEETKEEVTE